MLNTKNAIRTVEPQPTAAYFKNIKRGPIGTIRKALREWLPRWALLRISFIGGSVVESITDWRVKDRLVATLEMMNITEVKDFNIFDNTKDRRTHSSQVTTRHTTAEETVLNRMEKCIATIRNLFPISGTKSKNKLPSRKLAKPMENHDRREVETAGTKQLSRINQKISTLRKTEQQVKVKRERTVGGPQWKGRDRGRMGMKAVELQITT